MLANTPAAERMSARSKSRPWRNSVVVFLLRNSRIKLHLQLWNRLNRATRATRFLNLNLLSEFEFNQALARSWATVMSKPVASLSSDCHLGCVLRLGAIVP